MTRTNMNTDYNEDFVTEGTTWVSDRYKLVWDADMKLMDKVDMEEGVEYTIF